MFEVKGDRAQWRTIFEHISGMQPGEVVKYDELAGLLPDAPEGSVRSAFYRAVRECEAELKRTFANVRGVGFKMVDANEHERLARVHHKRAKRQLKTGKRKAASADRSRLSREERARIDAIELNLSRQIEMTNRLQDRVAKVETDLKVARREQRTDSAALADRVDRLALLLEKHGIADKAAA
ncbi:hypothetical protein ABGB07_02085 [Micromonosporaceae bacterium B7E4]